MNPFYRTVLFYTLSFFAFQSTAQTPKYSNEFLAIGVGAKSLSMANSSIANVDDVLSDLEGLSVLVIDNEEEIVEGMRILLERWGCVVPTATSTQEAFGLFSSSFKPEFIISDYLMPGEFNGIEFIRRVRKEESSIPSIMITGSGYRVKKGRTPFSHSPLETAARCHCLVPTLRFHQGPSSAKSLGNWYQT